jgi:peptide/nickel transport system substrate-binding protein
MKKTILLLALLVIAAMALAACQPAAPEKEVVVETVVVEGETVVETVVVEKEGETNTVVETVIVEVQATPEPVTREGGWLDTIIVVEEPSSDAAVTRLEAGDIDVFAYNISEPDIAQRVFDSTSLKYETSYGNYNDLTFMPSTTQEFSDGRLNPFFSDKIREAMNWLVDRDYITQEITGGLAVPRFVPVNYASKDSALLADTIATIELKYAHNPDKAVEIINSEMEAMGAEMVDGKWTYNGEPVVLTALIRVEDERLEIGDYVSNLLEDIGFTIERDYKTSAEASPCWLRGNPDDGCAHFYTGGWVSTAISRDAASNFSYYYTPDGLPFPPWQAYTPSPEFYDIATRLTNSEFANLDERADLMAQALYMALEDSQRIWLKDDIGVAPHVANVALASDLSGSIYGSWLWAQTIRFTDKEPGGSMTIAMPSIMTEPWNPIAGTNWVYDMMPMRGIGDNAVVPDPFTGLALPNRLEKAEVFVVEGLPVEQNLDWATLEFVPEIVVPDDAWVDWDAENQVFITAGEKFTETTTVLSKVVMYYEDDLFQKIKWHDGSPLTLADIVMTMIMQFDQAKEASPYYDEATVPNFQTFIGAFKGWRITSEDPLVVEFYTDAYQLDAENNITNLRTAYPSLGGVYTQGQAAWHNLAVALRMEGNGEAAFSPDKAEALGVEWMSFISGPTLELMTAQLESAVAENWIPFEPTLGKYITPEEAAERYANLQEWYRRYGHYYIGTGPFYLQKAFPVEGTIILQRNAEYPDMADKWDRFSTAPIPEVLVDGNDRVAIGEEAVYDVYVDFAGEPYAVEDISMARYLVFDATGNLAEVGDAEAVEDGYWTVTLSADTTGALAEGSNQLAVIIVSKRALVPVRDTFQFVTTP